MSYDSHIFSYLTQGPACDNLGGLPNTGDPLEPTDIEGEAG